MVYSNIYRNILAKLVIDCSVVCNNILYTHVSLIVGGGSLQCYLSFRKKDSHQLCVLS